MKQIYCLIILTLVALFGIKALFHAGFYTSHDGRHQIIRLKHFHQGLIDGQFPVRWAKDAFSGYGYPLFIFTYRLPFWLGEIWYLISHNLVNSIKFAFIITYVLSGFSMFWFAKELWSSKLAGLIVSILYLWAPYRFVDIFVRASLGEATCFLFIPLLFLALLAKNDKFPNGYQDVFLGTLALSGLILSHFMTLLLWIIPYFLWMILNWKKSHWSKKYLVRVFLIVFLSFGLTAYYWLPAMLEKQFTIFADVVGHYYQAHFVSLKQLIYSKWGFGFSMTGEKDDEMSFQVGLAQWLTIGIFGFYLLRIIISKFVKTKKIIKCDLSWPIYFLFIFLLSIFLMLEKSAFFYRFISKFMAIDIPWRFLGIAVFSGSMLAGAIVKSIKSRAIVFLYCFLIIALAFYSNRNHLKVNQYTYYPESEYWQDEETTNEYDDYRPSWFNNGLKKTREEITVLDGNSENKLITKNSNKFIFESKVETQAAQVIIKLAYYPGWQTIIDGKRVKTQEKDGRIKVDLSEGNHLVEIFFKRTKTRLLADCLSLIFIIIYMNYLYFNRNINAKKKFS